MSPQSAKQSDPQATTGESEVVHGLSCPVCKREASRIIRYGIRGEPDRPVYVCKGCGVHHITPVASNDVALREYYRTEYRKAHESTPGLDQTAEERFKLQYLFMADTAARIREYIPPGGSLLEIGCSAGGLLGHLQGEYELYGSEWNPEDAEYVRETGGIPCEEGLLEDIYPGKTFTAIVAIHVLEHQPDPIAWLKQIRERLIGGGWLYLEIPHLGDAMLSAYGDASDAFRNWWYQDSHVTYWLPPTLAATMDAVGFETRINFKQRYGLLNHMSWMLTGQPQGDPREARKWLRPVPEQHPLAPPLNREWRKLDHHYRISLEGLQATDSIFAIGARRQI